MEPSPKYSKSKEFQMGLSMQWKKWKWSSYQKKRSRMPSMKSEYLLPFSTLTLLVTKKLSSRTQPPACASLWNWQMEVIYWNWFNLTRKKVHMLQNNKYGLTSFKWLEEWKLYMTLKYCTEISNALTCFLQRMGSLSSVTWMSQRWPKEVCCILRLVHLIMLVLKFGRISHTIIRVTYGP